MSLLAMRAAVIETLKTCLKPLAYTGGSAAITVAALGGRLTADDLKRISVKSPAVLVACLGVPSVAAVRPSVNIMAQWGAFVITADRPGCGRNEAALAVTSDLLRIIPRQQWSGSAAGLADGLRAENLFGASDGVALWAVTWRQKITLEDEATAAPDLLAVGFNYYLQEPADGNADAADILNIQH